MVEPLGVDERTLERVRAAVAALPEVEESSDRWAHRFKVRRRVVAYVFSIEDPRGNAPTMVVCNADSDERAALLATGHPYFAPNAGHDRLGIVLDDGSDWAQIGELLVESYRLVAPRKLADSIE
jgi:hypothetical protein